MAEGNVSAASNGVENLTAQLRVLKKELATLDPNSSKFQELALQAGEVKDRINDASEAMNANAGSAFERLGNNASLLKDRLLNMDLEGVTSSIKGFAGQISGLSFKGVVDGVKGLGGALKALGTALLTNPIFLLVAALVAIGAAIKAILDDQRNDVDEANKAIDKSNEQRHNIERLRMAEAAGNEKALADLKKKSMQEDIKDTKAKIDNLMWMESQAYGLSEEQAKELDSLRGKYAQQRVDYEIEALKQIQILNAANLEYEKTIAQAGMSAREIEQDNLGQWYADQREKIEAAGATEEDIYRLDWAYGEKKKQLQEKFRTEDAAKSKAAADKRKSDKEKEDKEFLDAEEKRRASLYTAKDELEKLEFKGLENRKKNNHEFRTSQAVADAVALQNKKDQEEEMTAFTQKQNDARLSMASDALGSLMALNDAFQNGSEKSAKRAFQINKALSLAQAIMNTYQAVNAQLAVPQDAITGANYVKAGISLAMGLANVAKIAKTQFQSTSSGGGGASGGGGGGSLGSGGGGGSMTSVTPSFNPLNTSFLNNRPSQTGAVQAYVLSSNVSSAMEANQKVKDQTVL